MLSSRIVETATHGTRQGAMGSIISGVQTDAAFNMASGYSRSRTGLISINEGNTHGPTYSQNPMEG